MQIKVLSIALGAIALLLAGCTEETHCVDDKANILTSQCLSEYSADLSVHDICGIEYALPKGDSDRLAVWSSGAVKGKDVDASPPTVREFCKVYS